MQGFQLRMVRIMDDKCKNCGKLESQHFYYYKACYTIEQLRHRFESSAKEMGT